VAQWVHDLGQKAGLGTSTLPGANALYLPLVASRGVVGVLGVRPKNHRSLQNPAQLQLLETFANQTALAVESARLAEEAQRAQVLIETEKLRNALLSSVSHDLRTPLASITGAASSLLELENEIETATRRDLTQTIHEEATRLNRLLRNLLDMTRLESGAVKLSKEWQPLEEVIGAALTRLEEQLAGREVRTLLPPDLPFVAFDGVLLEQVLVNLLEHAIKYTPAGSPIEISAQPANNVMIVEIADHGPGMPPADVEKIFDKFYRTRSAEGKGGIGLGLTICKGIIEAHGGRIWAENRPDGGAAFRFTLPINGEASKLSAQEEI
jgi:two-component system sensor histidine kinase KdpD